MQCAGAGADEISRFEILRKWKAHTPNWPDEHTKLRDMVMEKIDRLEAFTARLRTSS
jgi:hypothetical protein